MTFLITAVGAFVFLRLGSELREGNRFGLDRLILLAFRKTSDPSLPIGPDWLKAAMIDITALGGTTVLTLITALTTGYLLSSRRTRTAIFLLVAVASGAMLSSLLKSLFSRPRPDLVAHLVEVHSLSFPSGHAMNSAIVYLTLGALLARAETDRAARVFLMAAAIMLTLIIGVSRVYLGVHWPSDVVAGWCVGASWAAFCSLVARALQRKQRIEAKVPDSTHN
jgi:undecaprenyl-diphosphatase